MGVGIKFPDLETLCPWYRETLIESEDGTRRGECRGQSIKRTVFGLALVVLAEVLPRLGKT